MLLGSGASFCSAPITVLALTRLYSDDHWRFQEHLLPDCVTRPSSRGLYPNEHWIFQEHLSMRWVESNETGQSKYVTRVFCQSFIFHCLQWFELRNLCLIA